MKKNAMLKIAAILMVAVLLTTCAISSTFAKYVTSDNDTAAARVAKWGVTVDVDADSAFQTKYPSSNEVVFGATYVVAPGTAVEDAVVITVTGTPEVKTTCVVNNGTLGNTDIVTLSNWEIPAPTAQDANATAEYCPVVFVINDVKYAHASAGLTDNGTTVKVSATVSALQTAINNAIVGEFSAEGYAAKSSVAESIAIDWYWNFTVDNEKDTALGNAAANAATDAAAPRIDFSMSITIAQDGPASADK